MEREKIILKVSYLSIIFNFILFVFKLVAGILGNSIAMISDAVHSFSDIATTIIVIIGTKISGKDSDEDHPYGHERLEAVMSVILAVILLIVGMSIGKIGIENIISSQSGLVAKPTTIALLAAVVSIIVKELMFWFTFIIGKKVDSTMLKADAWHHRSDSLSSIGSFVGVFGAIHGYIVLDGVASVIISLIIFKVSYDILKDSFDKLVDKSCDKEVVTQIEEIIKSIDGVIVIDELKTRMFADKIYVDVEVSVEPYLNVKEGHEIAENIHIAVEKYSLKIKHCGVHINPFEE